MEAGPDLSPVANLEARLAELATQLEQGPQTPDVQPQVSELEQRVQHLDAALQKFSERPTEGSSNDDLIHHISTVNDRIEETEQKLGHIDTIEKSIAQLFESIEQNRQWAKEVAEQTANRVVSEMPQAGNGGRGQRCRPKSCRRSRMA